MQTKSSSAELKASARQKLLGKYSILIGAFLIVEVLTSVISFAVTELCGFSSISDCDLLPDNDPLVTFLFNICLRTDLYVS